MRKFFIGFCFLGGVVAVLLIIARLTNLLQYYTGSSTAMSPTIEIKDIFFTTSLLQPKPNDIVVFIRNAEAGDGDATPGTPIHFVYRLIAKGGEKLELRNGLAYVNDKLVDDSTRLKFYYSFDAGKSAAVLAAIDPESGSFPENDWMINEKTAYALLNWPQYSIAQKITPLTKKDKGLNEFLYGNKGNKEWTEYNYGPIVVPADCYFLLGDNRGAAKDSRFIGPVQKSAVVGVVFTRK